MYIQIPSRRVHTILVLWIISTLHNTNKIILYILYDIVNLVTILRDGFNSEVYQYTVDIPGVVLH